MNNINFKAEAKIREIWLTLHNKNISLETFINQLQSQKHKILEIDYNNNRVKIYG